MVRVSQALKLDPVVVLSETDKTKRAARLAAYWVIMDDREREAEKMKAMSNKAKT